MGNEQLCVILDLSFAGYGAVRSLYKKNIPTIGLYNDKYLPEAYTKLCSEKIYFKDYEDLLNQLIRISKRTNGKPALILTADHFVDFFYTNQEILTPLFRIELPDNEVIELLLDKNKFSSYAKENDILIPPFVNIKGSESIEDVKKLRCPIILKPYLRTDHWNNQGLPKAFIIKNYDQFEKIYSEVSKVEQHLIAQEYIEGEDSDIYYCLVYYSSESKCEGSFIGKKLSQWPVLTGSTASTTISTNKFVREETLRVFDSLSFKGFGSIEFKRNPKDEKFYVIEPTVGRLNQQEYVATLCGVNLPYIGYESLMGNEVRKDLSLKKVIYIDLFSELRSVLLLLKRRKFNFKSWRKNNHGIKSFRLLNFQDKRVFFGFIFKLFRKFFNIK